MNLKYKLFAAAGVRNYWVVDPTFDGGIQLTENRIGDDGAYEQIVSTNKVFTTEVPYPVTIDLPKLTAWRDKARRAQAEA